MDLERVPGLTIVRATSEHVPLLWEVLAAAVTADPPWTVAQARSTPEIAHYLTGWPRPGDQGVIARVDDDGPVGGAWLRRFGVDDPGYGFVDSETPELTIACRPAWRGRGIGRRLLQHLLEEAQEGGTGAVSLSVDPANVPALALYRSLDFEEVAADAGGSVTMVRRQR